MSASATDRRWHTPAEIGELLNLPPATVLKFIGAGELIAHDLAGPGAKQKRYRIAAADLEAFLLRRRSQPAPAQQTRRRGRRKERFVPEATYY